MVKHVRLFPVEERPGRRLPPRLAALRSDMHFLSLGTQIETGDPAPLPPEAREYAFLVGKLIDEATLTRAMRLAEAQGVAPHETLLANGWVHADAYARALANHLGVEPVLSAKGLATGDEIFGQRAGQDSTLLVVNAIRLRPGTIASTIGRLTSPIALASPREMREARFAATRGQITRRAVYGLLRRTPQLSAARRMRTWQSVALLSIAGLMIGAHAIAADIAVAAWTALLTLPFFAVVLLRLLAMLETLRSGQRAAPVTARPDRDLPVYTVLVPLFRETGVLQPLIASLMRLDYPRAKLDIKLVLEEGDASMIEAAGALELPGMFDVIVVPASLPQTKPKALNYALAFAQGDFIVVFDAEDEPDPRQLRQAIAAFDKGGRDLGCLQASLNIYNKRDGWLTRQFTIEYSAQFDCLLPALEKLSLPLPLGGTSNHFRREALADCGAWDPHNVTEDADLGIRLARRGWRTGTIASTTWEEAPVSLLAWLRQRTRWLKGWMQTYAVHTRSPRALHRELGWRGAFAVHALLGGLVLSTLVHPLFYVLLAAEIVSGSILGRPDSLMGAGFWHLSIANLALGFSVAMLTGVIAIRRRGMNSLLPWVLTMPLYWLLISLAAYRAAWQLARDPFRWEKTDHGLARTRTRR
ncbi:MAG: glycosyltransferase [Hyphomicrobiaceae bacterium]|nr:MAG: glycosyltransferase [Hyphomicrobiaceae bacterium]